MGLGVTLESYMEDFTSILLNQMRFRSAVKELTIDELESVSEKLKNIIDKRIEKEKAEQARLEAKQKEIDGILSTMEKSGVTIDDLREGVQPKKEKKAKTPKNKVPPKYKLVDDDGEEHLWTGRGSMPLVFKHAINEQGKELATFEIK
ncbi:MAG: histone [Crocinitomicaceae bacterium]|nr:histone [Crocinitomicaceae bacterium]